MIDLQLALEPVDQHVRGDIARKFADAPDAHSVRDRDHLYQSERRFFIWMGLLEGADDFLNSPDWHDGFEPNLFDLFELSRLSNRWIGPVLAEERPGSEGTKTTGRIVSDPSGAGGKECIADLVDRFLRHECHQLVLRRCGLRAF